MDLQGPEAVAPWTRQYAVTFPVAVDAADVLGAAFGLKAIPVSYLVDEVGLIRLQGGGPSKEFLTQVEEILREPVSAVRGQASEITGSLPLPELRDRAARQPGDPALRLALAQALDRAGEYAGARTECEAAFRLRPNDAMVSFTHGLILLHQSNAPGALVQFKRARDLDPGNWRIRKQIWALEHPERFYGPEGIDWGWQKEQLAREKQ